jgi:hypothetical protein
MAEQQKKDERLLNACEQGNVEAVRQLLNSGANPNCEDTGFVTASPLSYAAESGEADVVRLLLSRGANIRESIYAFFVTDSDEILQLLVAADPEFAFSEFDNLDFVEGTVYETERRALKSTGYTNVLIKGDPIIRQVLEKIRFSQKIKRMARQLIRRGGGTRRRKQKRTYRRRTYK